MNCVKSVGEVNPVVFGRVVGSSGTSVIRENGVGVACLLLFSCVSLDKWDIGLSVANVAMVVVSLFIGVSFYKKKYSK